MMNLTVGPCATRWGSTLMSMGLAIFLVLPAVAADQTSSPPDAQSAATKTAGALDLEEIVVTAASAGQSRMRSSVAVSTLDADTLQQLQPLSAADVLRDIPGIRSEASGGEGNANVAVRGLPVA